MKRKNEERKASNKGWKRFAAVTLALLLAMGGMDLSGFAVNAKTDEDNAAAETKLLITAFAGLDSEITEQQLPVGASQEDIVFPDALTVTVKQITTEADAEEQEVYQSTEEGSDTKENSDTEEQEVYQSTEEDSDTKESSDAEEPSSDTTATETVEASDTDESGKSEADTDTDTEPTNDTGIETLLSALAPMKVCAAEGTETQLTLTDITWKIKPEESDGDTFDSSTESSGKCYTYVPVLPDKDADGNGLLLAEDAELPMIYVLIGERGVMPLENSVPSGIGSATITKQTVKPEDGTTVSMKGTLTYGESLSNLDFNTVKFVGQSGEEVKGTLEWKGANTVPEANTKADDTEITGKTKAFQWIFTPLDNINYEIASDTVEVTVYQAKPTVAQAPVIPTFPCTKKHYNVQEILDKATTPLRITGVKGEELTQIDWQWLCDNQTFEDSQQFDSGVWTVTAVGTVTGTNYQSVMLPIMLNVTKGTLRLENIEVYTYQHGDFLRKWEPSAEATDEAGLYWGRSEGNCVWKAPNTQLSYTDNGKSFAFIYVPRDTVNYNCVEGTVQIKVEKMLYPPNMPATQMKVSNSCGVVSEISLPTGWAWREADRNNTLTVGEAAITAQAIYTGADKDNYETTSVDVSISRTDCEHVETDVIAATYPTCTNTGTGYTECSRCLGRVRDSITIPATGHNYQRIVNTQGYFIPEGYDYYECSVCHLGYCAEPIAAPTSEGGSAGNVSESSGDSGNSGDSGSSGNTSTATAVTQVSQNKSREPFITSDTGAQGWAAIREYVQKAEEGSVITVSMNGASVVPADIMELIRGKAVMLAFDMGDGTAWVVSGLLMAAAAEGIPTVVYYEDELQGKLLFTMMTLTAEEAPVPVYYADYNKGTLTPADMAVMKTDAMHAHLYAYGQQCFAILYELGRGTAQTP